MNIIFQHNRNYEAYLPEKGYILDYRIAPRGGKTIAIEEIQAWLLDTVQVGTSFEKKVGSAVCSKEDNFCKKKGREIALSRLKSVTLHVLSTTKSDTDHIIVLQDKNLNLYTLIKYKKSNRVYFIDYI